MKPSSLNSADTKKKIAKYQQIVDEVRQQIKLGELQPGDRLPSRSDMASRGVNHTTLQRAHLALEQDGLIVRHTGRGIFVAEKAASDKNNFKGVIGLSGMEFMSTSVSAYWSQLTRGVYDVLHANSMQLMILEEDTADVWNKVDGILLNPVSVRRLAGRYDNKSRHCVSLLLPGPVDNMSSVIADDYAGQSEATRHLLDLGHKTIAYMCQRADTQHFGPLRRAGYESALHAAGIRPNPRWIRYFKSAPTIDFRHTGRDSMASWLKDDWEELGCTAIMLQNDEAAIGAIEALESFGIRVPQDVSVMGFDNLALCEYSRPPLTSVAVPLREIGQRATEILLDQISESDLNPQQIMLPARVHVRESTAPAAGSGLLSKSCRKKEKVSG